MFVTAINNIDVGLPSAGSSTTPIYINSSGVPTACSYSLGAAASKSVTTSVTSGSSALVTSGAVYTAINSKADASTVSTLQSTVNTINTYAIKSAGTSNQYWRSDGSGAGSWMTPASAPASGSTNLITAGAVYDALQDVSANSVPVIGNMSARYYFSTSSNYTYFYTGYPTWTINNPSALNGLTGNVTVITKWYTSSSSYPACSASYSSSITNTQLLAGTVESYGSSSKYNVWSITVQGIDVTITLTLSDGRVFTQQQIYPGS